MKIPESLQSRKLWLAIISALIVFLNKYLELDIKESEIMLIVGSLLSFVAVEGVADIKSRKSGK